MRAEGGRDPPAPASKRGKVRIRFVEPLPSLAPTVGIRFGDAQHDIPAYPSETDTRLAGAARWLSARDRDRGTPHGAAPPTPPGIRFTYLGGSTGLSFNAQCRCEAGRESRKRDCAVPSEAPGVLTYARSPSANRRQPRQGISQRLYGAIP